MNKAILKFNKIFNTIPARKSSLTVLSFREKIIKMHLNIGSEKEQVSKKEFREEKLNLYSIKSIYAVLSRKYEIQGMSVIDRDELLDVMDKLWEKEQESLGNLPYNLQLMYVYEKLGLFSNSKGNSKKFTLFYGNKNSANFFPETNFLLDIFDFNFRIFFPEKKNIVFGLMDDSCNSLEIFMFFFHKSRIFKCLSLDKEKIKSFLDGKNRSNILAFLKDKYKVPCYGVFITQSAWSACIERQNKDGKREAWRCFSHAARARERQVFMEPKSLALQASLYFKSIF